MSGGLRSEWKVRILHISDLHERGPRESEPFRRRRVLGDAWKRNLDELLKDGAIDLVCLTGDIADWGKPSEYVSASSFIEALLKQLSLPIERLFLVPGNHDIDRRIGLNTWAELRGGKDSEGQAREGKLSRAHQLELSRWMAGGPPPAGLERVSREELLSRQSAYRNWVAMGLGRKELVPGGGSPHPFLGYRQSLRLPGQPFDIHLVGLDSAWLAGDDSDRGKLLLTTNQVGQLTTDKGELLPGFRLALVHHPLSELADEDDCKRLLADHVDLLLRGHLHDGAVDTWEDPDRTSRQLAAGCLYEGHLADEWPNACHVMTATLDSQGRPLYYDLRFRSWSKRGHWYDENRLYQGARNGRLRWWIRRAPSPSTLPVTGVFVGREHELEELEKVLLPAERSPVAICAVNGMPGVGKSYLATRFAELHAQDFPGGIARLVLNPMTLPSVEVLLGELGAQLELPASDGLAERCRNRLLDPLSLLIVENVDSKKAADVAVQIVSDLPGCPILVTGRYQGFSQAGGWHRIEVQTLDEATALQLLGRELGSDAGRFERPLLQKLVRVLGNLPLALHLAAGHLRAGDSAASFLERLREQGLDVEPVDRNDPLLRADHARAILRHTFELSLRLLRRQLEEKEGPRKGVRGPALLQWLRRQLGSKPRIERLLEGLSALGHAPPTGFGRNLGAAIAGVSAQEFGELLVSASLLSLLQRVPLQERRDEAWRVHPLLAELLHGQPHAALGLERMSQWFVERLPVLPAGQEHEQGERWSEIHREGNALADWLLLLPDSERVQVERAGSWYAISQGPFPVWVDFCERALASKHPLTPQEQSHFLWTLGNVARRSGALDRALAAAERKGALDRERKDPLEVAQAAAMRADILQARGELDQALRIRREEVLPVYERLGDVLACATTLGKVADILQSRGQADEALRIRKEEQLPVYERLGDVRARAVTLGKVADILRGRDQLDEALHLLKQEVLPAFTRLGDVRERTATLGMMADILYARARQEEPQGFGLREELSKDEKAARTLRARVHMDEARRILQQEVLPSLEQQGDADKLFDTLGTLRRATEARIGMDMRLGRRPSPFFLSEQAHAAGKMADIMYARGQVGEAMAARQEEELHIYEIAGDVGGKAASLGRIADGYEALGHLDEALRVRIEEELPVYERLGDVRACAVTLGKVADILQARGQLDEALRLRREEQLPVYERLGDVRERAVALFKIATILQAQGSSEEALGLLRQKVLPIFERMGARRELEVTQQLIAQFLAKT
jgi:tetratricopeptide (TPR) repeat protein